MTIPKKIRKNYIYASPKVSILITIITITIVDLLNTAYSYIYKYIYMIYIQHTQLKRFIPSPKKSPKTRKKSAEKLFARSRESLIKPSQIVWNTLKME